MHARNIPTNFDFWFATAGFDINQSVISYSATSTYGRAFFVGLINTLIVAFAGIVIASVLGFALGVARLSSNWLTAKLASGYVEVIRNTPLLLQLLFWYNAVLKPLPSPRETLVAPDVTFQTPSANTGAIGGTLLVLALLLFVAAR
ncbi:MAG: ABC transporter permease subunit, partial [Alphaproteobacteria bacterium]|nr:ABC transporter permease subunit [Alphaproteobacteria bacterium]